MTGRRDLEKAEELGVREHFASTRISSEDFQRPHGQFGPRTEFVPQKERVKRLARTAGGLFRIGLFLMRPANLAKLITRRIW